LDKQPLAVKGVEEEAKKRGFSNIDTMLSDKDTGLPDESVDGILLYGVLPEIKNKESLLRESHRTLKPEEYLPTRFCFSIKRGKILEIMEATDLFSLREQKGYILHSEKAELRYKGITVWFKKRWLSRCYGN